MKFLVQPTSSSWAMHAQVLTRVKETSDAIGSAVNSVLDDSKINDLPAWLYVHALQSRRRQVFLLLTCDSPSWIVLAAVVHFVCINSRPTQYPPKRKAGLAEMTYLIRRMRLRFQNVDYVAGIIESIMRTITVRLTLWNDERLNGSLSMVSKNNEETLESRLLARAGRCCGQAWLMRIL